MPYDPNYPYGFQYGNYYQRPQQFQNNTYAFVNGIEGAKSYIVQPNQTVLLMDSDSPVCFMKSANSLGQCTLRYFKLTEIKEDDLRTFVHQNQEKPISLDKNEEFVHLKERVEAIEKKLGENNE